MKTSIEEDVITRTFVTTLGDSMHPITLKLPIKFPCTDDPTELAHRFIQHHNLPIFLHERKFSINSLLHLFSSSNSADL